MMHQDPVGRLHTNNAEANMWLADQGAHTNDSPMTAPVPSAHRRKWPLDNTRTGKKTSAKQPDQLDHHLSILIKYLSSAQTNLAQCSTVEHRVLMHFSSNSF
jgi:hypothetical protein